MAFGAGGSFGNFMFGADYLMKTVENCASAGGSGNTCPDAAFATTETSAMGVHLWATLNVNSDLVFLTRLKLPIRA